MLHLVCIVFITHLTATHFTSSPPTSLIHHPLHYFTTHLTTHLTTSPPTSPLHHPPHHFTIHLTTSSFHSVAIFATSYRHLRCFDNSIYHCGPSLQYYVCKENSSIRHVKHLINTLAAHYCHKVRGNRAEVDRCLMSCSILTC